MAKYRPSLLYLFNTGLILPEFRLLRKLLSCSYLHCRIRNLNRCSMEKPELKHEPIEVVQKGFFYYLFRPFYYLIKFIIWITKSIWKYFIIFIKNIIFLNDVHSKEQKLNKTLYERRVDEELL